jgi:hypothetical protein
MGMHGCRSGEMIATRDAAHDWLALHRAAARR